MRYFFAVAIIAASALTLSATSHEAFAGKAEKICSFYKKKAVKTGSPTWWHRYYACLAKNR